MNIKWNEVTWYSKLLSIIFLLGVVPTLTFYIGTEYEGALSSQNQSIPQETVSSNPNTIIDTLNSVYGGKIVDTQYGVAYGQTQKGIEWYPSASDAQILGVASSTKLITAILSVATTTSSNQELLLTQTTSCDAHVCGAELGGAILSGENGGWKVDVLQKNIDNLGSFGNIPSPSVVQIGKNQFAFRIDNIDGGQGLFLGPLLLYMVVNGKFQKVLEIKDSYMDNGGTGDDPSKIFSYKTSLAFSLGSNSDYYDIEATTDGTRHYGTDIGPVHKDVNYVFDGKQYVLKAGM